MPAHEFDYAGRDRIPVDEQFSRGDRQLETTRPGTPWVDIENVAPLFDNRLVRMTGNNDANPGSRGCNIKLREIVDDVDGRLAHLQQRRFGQLLGPRPLVVVAPH